MADNVIKLAPAQFERSLDAVFDFRVKPHAEYGFILEFKAKPREFFPRAFDGKLVQLEFVERGRKFSAWGHLKEIPATEARGMWFGYIFVAFPPFEAPRIRFEESYDFSNLSAITLTSPDGDILPLENALYR